LHIKHLNFLSKPGPKFLWLLVHAAMNPCLWFLVLQEFGCRRSY